MLHIGLTTLSCMSLSANYFHKFLLIKNYTCAICETQYADLGKIIIDGVKIVKIKCQDS